MKLASELLIGVLAVVLLLYGHALISTGTKQLVIAGVAVTFSAVMMAVGVVAIHVEARKR